MDYTINQDFSIHGYLLDSALVEPEYVFGRDHGLYFALIQSDNPYERELVESAYQQFAEEHQYKYEGLDSQPADKSLLRFESILPTYGAQERDGSPRVKTFDYVRMDVRLTYTNDASNIYLWPRLELRCIHPGYRAEEDVDWGSVPATYNW